MANIYTFSFVPVAPAWNDPLDETIQHPSRRLGQRTIVLCQALLPALNHSFAAI
jgi:hypothetical protein